MEVPRERGDDPRERVQVRTVFADELVCARALCCSERASLSQPPLGGPLVEGGDIELVHHQHAAGFEQLREVPDGLLERLDVVKRGDGDRRGERAGRLCQLVQRDRTNIDTARLRSIASTSNPASASARASAPSPAPISSRREGGGGRFARTKASGSEVSSPPA
jgi:hypothetical protein